MSYSLFLQRFQHGRAADFDAEVLRLLVRPHVVYREPENGFVELGFADGGSAELYSSDGDDQISSVMITRFSSGDALEFVARTAISVEGVVLLQDGVALVVEAGQRVHLPEELQADAVVVRSGAEIQAVIDRLRVP